MDLLVEEPGLIPPEKLFILIDVRSRDSSVSIVTRYGLDDQGSIPGRGRDFSSSIASRPALRPT
jgi:hypothetical protein